MLAINWAVIEHESEIRCLCEIEQNVLDGRKVVIIVDVVDRVKDNFK